MAIQRSIGLVAHCAERPLKMVAVWRQEMLPIAVGTDAEFHFERAGSAGRDRGDDEIDQPSLGQFLAFALVPIGIVPEKKRALKTRFPRRQPDAYRIVFGITAADLGPFAGMTERDAVGLEIGDVLDHHQSVGRPLEAKLQPAEAHDVQRFVRVVVLDAGGDRQILSVERVIRGADHVAFDVANAGLFRAENRDRLRAERLRIHAAASRVLEPRLGVEDRPAAAGQLPAGKSDRRQSVGCDLKLDSLRGAIGERVGRGRGRFAWRLRGRTVVESRRRQEPHAGLTTGDQKESSFHMGPLRGFPLVESNQRKRASQEGRQVCKSSPRRRASPRSLYTLPVARLAATSGRSALPRSTGPTRDRLSGAGRISTARGESAHAAMSLPNASSLAIPSFLVANSSSQTSGTRFLSLQELKPQNSMYDM